MFFLLSIDLGMYLNLNLHNSGVRIYAVLETELRRNRVGIVHKNWVGVGIGTKMTGVGIEKVCWNRPRTGLGTSTAMHNRGFYCMIYKLCKI